MWRITVLLALTLTGAVGLWLYAAPRTVDVPVEWRALFAAIDADFVSLTSTAVDGEELSHSYCGLCHLRPEPEVLPRESWLEVFRILTGRFYQAGILEGPERPAAGSERELNPHRLSLPRAEYRALRIPKSAYTKILYYYLSASPLASLPQRDKPAFADEPAAFEVVYAAPATEGAQYSLADFDAQTRRFVLGDAARRSLQVIDGASGRAAWEVPVGGIYPMGLSRRQDGLYLVTAGPDYGSIAENRPDGALVRLPGWVLERPPIDGSPEVLIDGLRFPIHAVFADLDGDGNDDVVVEEFGMSEGALSWFSSNEEGVFERRHVLYEGPGTLNVAITDLTGDQRPDIVALVTQADETVYLFENEGGGRFEGRRLLQKHPAFGFDGMWMHDMDGDGHLDLVTVNGDNDLETQPLRPYHGVRVWRNDGQANFTEAFFYPMHGALQAVIRDFDNDGALDIVAVARWPDITARPLETAVYLENAGGWSWRPKRLPGSEDGKWAVVGTGDADGDGYDDIVFGALYLPGDLEKWGGALEGRQPLAYLVLRNTAGEAPARR